MADTPSFGFDKSAAIAAQNAAANPPPPPLEPPFPYTVLSFDPDFFGFPANPSGLPKELLPKAK